MIASALASPAAAGDEIETAGEVLRVALPVGAAGIALLKDDRDGLLQLGLSEAASFGTAFLLTKLVKERRPEGEEMDSFPSDSTAIAFSAAAYLERRYGWDYGLPAYALAAFVGYSRVQADKHHWHDVAAGALIGWGASRLIVTPENNPQVSLSAGYRSVQLRAVW